MLAGDLYIADDPEIVRDAARVRRLLHAYNTSPPDGAAERRKILDELLAGFGDGSEIRPPFYCDLGFQLRVGARTFANFGLVALDVAAITIGDDVWLGGGAIVLPGVSIGDDAVVGAGAVVTRDLPAGIVAVGNPARVIRSP